MTFLLLSFFAGVLTVLAPCILPLLPVVIGSSASGRSKATPYIIVGSLGISIILFTYLLKVSSLFITIPPETWTYLSGGILILFGITLLFPDLWSMVPGVSKLSIDSNKLLGAGYQKKSFWGDVIVGASLGPIFSTCSPTYFVILASVLPASFLLGSVYLFSYTIGLSLVLLGIALLGEKFARRLDGFSNPKSFFKRAIGVLFIILGVAIVFGYEKKLETRILDSGYFDITKVEQSFLQKIEKQKEESDASMQNDQGGIFDTESSDEKNKTLTDSSQTPIQDMIKKITTTQKKYKEIVNPSGFVNTKDQPIKIGDYVGKKVILLDIMTYSCINCQRTFPYVVAWSEMYKDDGLIVIGIHTPEFAFEKDKKNVEDAMARFGIKFPVVLDNDYGTWGAYGNNFWPRKYLIDINGNIVYDHIGEGAYQETEKKILELLKERSQFLGEKIIQNSSVPLASDSVPTITIASQSPETYFGSARNEYFGNGTPSLSGEREYALPSFSLRNTLYLGGKWNLSAENAEAKQNAKVVYKYNAQSVYLVASASTPKEIEVWQDGSLVTDLSSPDVNAQGILTVKESRLYTVINNSAPGEHTLELRVRGSGALLYAFTFG